MKKLLICLLALICFKSYSQQVKYEKDTLYTSIGWKITDGTKIKFGKGTAPTGDFNFIRINSLSLLSAYSSSNPNAANSANNLNRAWANTGGEVANIRKIGTKKSGYSYQLILKIGSTVRYECDIESAIASGEVVPPEKFAVKIKNESPKPQMSIADELKKLKELLDAGVLTQEEFDAQKKKLLGQ